jgi:hypothetical protein
MRFAGTRASNEQDIAMPLKKPPSCRWRTWLSLWGVPEKSKESSSLIEGNRACPRR